MTSVNSVGFCSGLRLGLVLHDNICNDHICDRACENQPCERKLHRVIFSAISSALNMVSHFRKFQKKAH